MSFPGEIHWHEGLFLQAQHMQVLQRKIRHDRGRDHCLNWSFPYGLIRSRLLYDELESGQIHFSALEAIMPSGLKIDISINTYLEPISIKKRFSGSNQPLTISLGVPLWTENHANTIEAHEQDDWNSRRIFKVVEMEVMDENAGDNPKPVLARKINARLLLDGDDSTGMEVLPLCRVVPGTGEFIGLPRLDSEFIPPSLVLEGSRSLRELVEGIARKVEASARKLAGELADQMSTLEGTEGMMKPVLRLRSLNEHGVKLLELIKLPNVAPFDIYLALRELFAGLCSVANDPAAADPFEAPDYDHDEPGPCFRELERLIDHYMMATVKVYYIKAQFERESGGSFSLDLTDQYLNEPSNYYLGVSTRKESRELIKLIESGDSFKLMAPSMVSGRALPGLELTVEHAPPHVLPTKIGLYYFKIKHSDKDLMWEAVKKEKKMLIIAAENEIADSSVELYMTISEKEND